MDGQVKIEVLDPQDLLIYRFAVPTEIDSARYLIHQCIFKTIGEFERTSSTTGRPLRS